jgi:hypothetical protein
MAEDLQAGSKSSGGVLGKLLGLVVVLALVYLGGFLLWRWQLESFDDLARQRGVDGGLPDWVDGGNAVLVVDDDSSIDTLGFTLFTPLVALEESTRDVNYVETARWKFWQ